MLDCMELLQKGLLYQDCFQIYISKILVLSIVLFSSILKVPQIRNILKEESVEGLTSLSIYCELIVCFLSSLYAIHIGIPFSTYGENLIIFVQCFIILLLFWKYSGPCNCNLNKIARYIVILSLIGFAYLCNYENGEMIPESVWTVIGSSSIPIISIGRFSMIYNCYSKKSTGTISLFNFLLNFIGNITRLFTLFSETKEYLLMFSMFYCSILNFIICAMIFIYGDKKVHKSVKKD